MNSYMTQQRDKWFEILAKRHGNVEPPKYMCLEKDGYKELYKVTWLYGNGIPCYQIATRYMVFGELGGIKTCFDYNMALEYYKSEENPKDWVK